MTLDKRTKIIIAVIAVALVVIAAIGLFFIAARINQTRRRVAPTAPESVPSAATCSLEFEVAGPTPTPAPVCNDICTDDTDCPSSMICSGGFCRNPVCEDEESCTCSTPSPTPTATPVPTATPTPVPQCNSVCSTDNDCPSAMICSGGYCRNPSCTTSTTCVCATATPTPSVTTTPTPRPTSSPTPSGGFYIRKYFDANGNGSQDDLEHGLTWKYTFDINGDENWREYEVYENKQGEGGIVTLPVGTEVRIKENAADGWIATTPTEVSLTIRAGENQRMVFGNWQGPGSTPPPVCGSSCTEDSDCAAFMTCVNGVCRNPSCSSASNCVCATTSVTYVPPEEERELPKAGASTPTLVLVSVGLLTILIGIIGLLAL